jgi:membrane-associated phospholipid phosphatase
VRGSKSSAAAWRLATVLGAAVVVGALAWLVDDDRVPLIDHDAFTLLALSPGSLLTKLAEPASNIAPFVLAACALAIVLALMRRRIWTDAAAIVAGFAVCSVGAHLAKSAEARPRPAGTLITAEGFSFPSTSSALCIGFVAIALALRHLTSNRMVRFGSLTLGCLLAFAAGLLFIALRVHYLTDVIAGWAFGIAAFTACDLAVLPFRAPRSGSGRLAD